MTLSKNPHVWAKIVQLYQPTLEERNIHIVYDLDDSKTSEALQLESEMNTAIQKVEKQTNITKQGALGNPGKKKILTQALKQDQAWNACFKNICEFFSPNLDSEEAVEDIDRPFWDNLQFGFISDNHNTSDYYIDSNISHSLLTQLAESTKAKYGVSKLQPVSVVSNVITADNRLVLGHRGGNNYSDVVMNIPAGSVEAHLKPEERGALFGSYDKELMEELALKPEHCESSELIARVEERLLVPNGWHYYVFRTRTKMELGELLEHWEEAVDKEEHRHLIFYDAENPDIILSTIKYNSFNPNKAGERMNQTTPENIGTILPQCSGSVLAYLTAEHGLEWATGAEKYLGGHYDLTSCFNGITTKNE